MFYFPSRRFNDIVSSGHSEGKLFMFLVWLKNSLNLSIIRSCSYSNLHQKDDMKNQVIPGFHSTNLVDLRCQFNLQILCK